MVTVREETFRLLRLLGLTTIFGNPGSTELPFLRDYPDDFRYVLGLQEASVLGMADGYAQASGQAALVNLHTAPGVGNAMGNIVTAFYNHSPLIITAGQQTRAMMALEPLLFARDAVELPKPYVKWSYEPARAQDVPAAIIRAYHMATQQPRGPVFLSIPMDDWDAEVEPLALHEVAWRIAPDPISLQEVARQLRDSQKLAMVVGADADRDGAWQQMIELAERTNAAVWRAPLSARVGFPDTHPLFQGDLPPAARLLAEKLSDYDTVLVVGGPVFHYYPYVPGPIVKEGTNVIHISNDPEEAARIQVGRSVIGHIALTIEQLLSRLPHTERTKPAPRRTPEVPEARTPISPAFLMHTLGQQLPANTVVLDESPSTAGILRRYVKASHPGSFYMTASGGLGYAMPAAIGVKLALHDRPVACVVGDGSSMYSIQSLWTAAQLHLPVLFVVLRNETYAILKAFARFEQVGEKIPGLDLPGLDILQIARGFGCEARRVEQPQDLVPAIQQHLQAKGPTVLEVLVEQKESSLL
ncbi:benzoylformate decarboxylase [Dictyobacter aurantiacus]|uniref:Benzoylformate decarboxylase n=1 Tax=Dictyobacter aurantiacus TaxID=1936993 RepID=A0A401ZMJ4_9CHLR|nr:benzoylformate decarboxylase [Dictyobacter aurantiacus]GCE08040.1 benzoylformate decarboxylase [Dictyobacter aurantiacus]